MRGLRLGIVALCFFLPACGDVVWFVSWNSGFFEDEGLVVIIGTPVDPAPASIRLLEGDIPAGMKLQNDGTVSGTPETPGPFDFTLEFTDDAGTVFRENFFGEIEET